MINIYQHRNSNPHSTKGFSLAEILFGLALLGTMIVCFLQVMLMGHFAIRQEREIVIATNIATEEMERVIMYTMGIPDDDPSLMPINTSYQGKTGNRFSPDYPPPPYPSVTVNDIPYTINVEMRQDIPSAGASMKYILVTVEWEAKSNSSIDTGSSPDRIHRSVTLTNVVPEYQTE